MAALPVTSAWKVSKETHIFCMSGEYWAKELQDAVSNTLALDFCAIVLQCSLLALALLILLVLNDVNVLGSAR